MKRAVIVGVVCASAVALAACGSSSGSRGVSSPAPSPHVSPTPSVPPRDLKPQLLTVADLPTGWSVNNSPDSGGPVPQCIKAMKGILHAYSHADADFIDGTDFPQFTESLGYFGSSAATAAKLHAAAAVLDTCKAFSFTTEGHEVTGSVGALSFPKVGDQSSAWQVVLTIEGISFGLDVMLVQKGPELASLGYDDVGTPDIDEATSLAGKAAAKMSTS